MLNTPLFSATPVNNTGASGFTVTLNVLLSCNGGTPLSVTVIWMLVEVPAVETGGRQLNAPLAAPMVPGPLVTLKVNVLPASPSVAEAVKETVWPGLTVKLPIGARTGCTLITSTEAALA